MNSIKNTNRKAKIYLADLVHNYIGRGPFMFPINIGYMKAYIKKIHGDDLEVRLFKYPNKLIEAIERDPPNILGLSNYTWNENLNNKILHNSKKKFSDIITIMGGPNVNMYPQIGHDEVEKNDSGSLTNFLKQRSALDFYVTLQGEPGFLNLVNRYLESDRSLKSMKKSPINGVAFLNNGDGLIREDSLFIRDLSYIPSPYLTGVMDEFFQEALIPNMETDRGCPYPCTFCAWGSSYYQKMGFFPKDRIKQELEYIVDMESKTRKTNILCIDNSNFGINDNDVEFAQIIRELSDKSGYPRKVTTFWAKNQKDRVEKIANILGGRLVSVDASLQSMNPATLEATKRKNISQEAYKYFLTNLNKKGIDSDAEMIYGLPEETRESYLNALKKLFEWRAGNLLNYHCRILKGAEMSNPKDIKKYDVKTKFRLIDIQFGEYSSNGDNFKSFEVEEMVKSNRTMSEEDIYYFRKLHWLINFTWNYKYYRGLLEYGLSNDINPIDFYNHFLENINNAPKKVQKLVGEFDEESRSEWFPTVEALIENYSKPENFKDVQNGSFDKLHFKYGFKTLLECPDEFDQYMAQTAKDLILRKNNDPKKVQTIDDLIKFENIFRVNFSNLDLSKEFEIEQEKHAEFNYDILKWKQNAYGNNLENYHNESTIKYRFYLPQDQVAALKNYINQFKNVNPLFTLRKMSEYMGVSDLFYMVESKDIKDYRMQSERHEFHTSKLAQ